MPLMGIAPMAGVDNSQLIREFRRESAAKAKRGAERQQRARVLVRTASLVAAARSSRKR